MLASPLQKGLLMKNPFAIAAVFAVSASLVGCAANEESALEDGENEIGVTGGKADGAQYTGCQLDAVVKYLNDWVTTTDLTQAGIGSKAAKNLVARRNGADGAYGTADDKPYETIEDVDAVPYVGPRTIAALVALSEGSCNAPTPDPEPADIYAAARDVNAAKITFPAGTVAPTSYDYPSGNAFNLSGTEFWQKWSGGHNPTYTFEEGTDAGRLCMQASAIRFETIMKTAPAELKQLLDESNWGGSFFNWNDDYSQAGFDSGGARLWAWRTGLIKWISATHKDGSCSLPTLDLVKRAAVACLATSNASNKEIQGCQAR